MCRVSTGIPGYGLRTEMIRKFFPFPLWKRFWKTGIPERFPERFFPRKTEISGITDRYGIPEISGFRNNWYHNYIKVLQDVNTTPVSNTNNIWMDAGR